MSLWQSYRSLSSRTRLFIGLGIMAYAGAGLFLSDTAEKKLGLEPTPEDKEKLSRVVPKITMVGKEEGS